METRESYDGLLRDLEARWRPTPRNVFRNLFKSPRKVLADAARDADEALVMLEAHEPPDDMLAAHDELTKALRQLASDAGDVAGRKNLHRGRRLLTELRDKPSYHRFVEAWRAIRDESRLRR